MISEVYNEDCMIGMARYPDKFFDLAIVDPPYGLNFGSFNRTNTDPSGNKYKANKYHNSGWDVFIPDQIYFDELFRISKNQIIWGGNYFNLPPTQCFIFWYKQNPVKNFSDGELAWTSFKKPALCFDYRYYGGLMGKTSADDKIHPTQKPIDLYRWLLQNFAKAGDKIFDSHLGSGTNRIACHDEGFDFYGWEINKEYFTSSDKLFKQKISQTKIF